MNMTLCSTPFIPANVYAEQVGQSKEKIIGFILINSLPGKKLWDGEWYVNLFALNMEAAKQAEAWLESRGKLTEEQHLIA